MDSVHPLLIRCCEIILGKFEEPDQIWFWHLSSMLMK